jgi:hypothetical protein
MRSQLQDDAIPAPRAPIPHALEDFLLTMPAAYHDRFSEADARLHAGIVLRRQGAPIHVEICGDDQVQPGLLCVVTDHLPGLMRMVAAVLAAHSLNILDKAVYFRSSLRGRNEAVFFFRVVPLNDGDQISDHLVATLRSTMIDVLKGKIDISALCRRSTPTWRPLAPVIEEPAPSSSGIDRLSQVQMTEPPPAPHIPRYSRLPQLV